MFIWPKNDLFKLRKTKPNLEAHLTKLCHPRDPFFMQPNDPSFLPNSRPRVRNRKGEKERKEKRRRKVRRRKKESAASQRSELGFIGNKFQVMI